MITRKGIFTSALVLLALSLPAVFWLCAPGFYEPHDLHHFADIYQMVRAFQSGQIPPRLGPDFTFGYGYPLFNFYYVLPFYLGAFWSLLVGSLAAGFKFVFITSVILSVYGMYLFLREFVGKWPAIVGSTLFLYTPYRAVEIYVRGAMGEALALSLLPFVLWGIVRIMKRPKNKKLIVGISLITAAFILSHNYLWALAFPWIGVLVLLLMKKKQNKTSVIGLLLTGLLSIGLTAYWWLPALIESKLVASITPFPLVDHFPFIRQLIIPSWGYGSSVWGPGDEISFQVGLVNLTVVGIVLLFGLYKVMRHPEFISGSPLRKILNQVQNDNRLLLAAWALIGFSLSSFMMNIRSYPIWKIIPFANFIQFPWRLLIFTTLFTSTLAAVLVEVLPWPRKKVAGILIIGASILLTFNYFQPSQVFYRTDNDYLARFFANRTVIGKKDEVSGEYLQYSEDYLLLPNWVERRPSNLPRSKVTIDDGLVLDIEEISSIYWKSEVIAAEETKVTFHAYYFPGWYAKVNRKDTEINHGEPYGQIQVAIPEGKHKIEFFWKETKLRRVANYISFAGLIGVFVTLFYPFRRIRS